MAFPRLVKIVEVGPRDGLQNEPNFIPTEAKIALIDALATTGLPTIEVTSFVSPKKIPQLKDAYQVLKGIQSSQVEFPVLVPNLQGMDEALKAGARSLSLFTSASETFNQKNINCSVAESIKRFEPIITHATKNSIRLRGYLSCCLGCPYEGNIDYAKSVSLAKQLITMGVDEISFGDTIGIGGPGQVMELIDVILSEIPLTKVAMHFHDTYGQALTNIYASLSRGINVFDSSLAGLGGCPYAKGATGNVATEDVLYLMQTLGIETGVDLKSLAKIGRSFCRTHNITHHSKVGFILTGEEGSVGT